ncbi:hypothetical protein SPBR_02340 [Sporothrix brasiliensis 5110]|uniref:Structure-specific endonuclease subunit SLX4 n=1 Tax=Sporothrix brasiliensis 5110 TaxID=1398154 RepID=A0A0C2J2E0_9PEZI|nr:uncharacterized protein SPBR_02340 [Sporothrix brasiliensis 5110]KIH93200.1 hypothetical protein SPBR_02340 [Sporothrix brasiliensis 5110]
MARTETRVQTGSGPPDLRDVILLSSSPALPPARPMSSLQSADTSRPAWHDRRFDLPLLSSDPPEAAARSGPPPTGAAQSKYFADHQDVLSSLPASQPAAVDLLPILREEPAKYVSGDLESALQRRRDWTPPPADTVAAAGEISRSQHHADDWSSSPGELVNRPNSVFKSLQTSFGCKEDESQRSNHVATVTKEGSFTKRKAIEAISMGDAGRAASRETSPTKSKAPKKKVRTLTELAVAAYADSTVTSGDALAATLTKTTTKQTTKPQVEGVDENVPEARPEVRPGLPMSKLRKLKTARAAAAAKKPRGKKAPAPRKPVLLSPASARAAATRQDFLFGTSSQLATEASPTFLRHLHMAMHASNQDSDDGDDNSRRERNRILDIIDEFDSDTSPDVSTVDLTGQRTPGRLEVAKKTKTLWGAAARGEDGFLIDNVIDLEDAMEFPEDPHQVIAMAQRAAEEAIQKEAQEEEPPAPALASTAAESTQATQSSRGNGRPPANAKAAEAASTAQTVVSPAQKGTKATSTKSTAASKSKAKKATNATKATKAAQAVKAHDAVRPNFAVLTTAQLTKKVSDYGYKAIKARSAMITLLNACWDAQHPTTAADGQPAPVALASTDQVAAQLAQPKDATAPTGSESLQTQPKVTAPRVAQPAATQVAQTTQSAIRGLTTSPRAAYFLPKGTRSPTPARTAALHTTAKATAKTTAKARARATATESALQSAAAQRRKATKECVVFEIDDSESDGRFSSPEPAGVRRPLTEAVAVDVDEDVENGENDDDDIVATDLDEDDESNTMDNDEADLSLADAPLTYEQSELFRYIATAVTSAPPTSDPAAPSWHEKILMYDTIILETFTAWLNNGPLRAAGYAGVDVTPLDVKKWCESKSVCCTWRKNLQGKERKW